MIYDKQNSIFVSGFVVFQSLSVIIVKHMNVAVFLASDASNYITGQIIVVDGGMTIV